MEQRIRKSFLLMFPLFITVFLVIVITASWINATFIQPSLVSFQCSAANILEHGLDQEIVAKVTDHGGGIMLIHRNGEVEILAGMPLWDGDVMSMQEIADFMSLVNDPSATYTYSIAYDEKTDAYLVAGFPISIRFQMFITANHDSKNYLISLLFYILLGICFCVTLFFSALCYARKSAKGYSVPLQKVCDSVRQIAQGNYNVTELDTGIEEYNMLQKDVMRLATLLQKEKKNSKQLADSKRQMLLDISHDLRNPLATILGYSENLCKEEELSKQERENYVEVIYRNSMRAHELMNDLFEYTRLEDSSLKTDKTPTDICEFLREFAASYVPEIESAGFESDFDIPEEEWFVLLDRRQMERALGNIVSNSLRYNPPKTQLKLTLHIMDAQAIIHICDTGVGIDAELCENIFLPFTRVDSIRNSMLGGSGLGLSISKKIIEAMGGSIRLDSNKDQGCDFCICLPVM